MQQSGITNSNHGISFYWPGLASQVLDGEKPNPNWAVCLMLDVNKAHEDRENGLSSFLEQTILIDSH